MIEDAQMQGADLRNVQMDEATRLANGALKGASVRGVDLTNVPQITPYIAVIFGDMATSPPAGVERPEHWTGVPEDSDWGGDDTEWRT